MTGSVTMAMPRAQQALRWNWGRLLDPALAGAAFAPTAYNAEGLIVAAGPDFGEQHRGRASGRAASQGL